jgi:hypothetical protein
VLDEWLPIEVALVARARAHYDHRIPMVSRVDRVVLALEIALGVLPITVVGGLYSIMGLYFGAVAVVMSLLQRAPGVLAVWFGIFALGAGGLLGIIGLWAVVLICAGRRPPSAQLVRAAVYGSVVGVLASVTALLFLYRGTVSASPIIIGILLAPILVVAHRVPAIARLS